MIRFYLEYVFKVHVPNTPALAEKFKGMDFSRFYDTVAPEFTIECYKGATIRWYFIAMIVAAVAGAHGMLRYTIISDDALVWIYNKTFEHFDRFKKWEEDLLKQKSQS